MKRVVQSWGMLCILVALVAAGCGRGASRSSLPSPSESADRTADGDDSTADRNGKTEREPSREEILAEAMAKARAAVPETPELAQPKSSTGTRIWREAVTGKGMRILVSTEGRALWLMRDTTVVMRAPVAVGMQKGFVWAGTAYDFKTPISKRRVLSKETVPIWTPPDWHYYEIALEQKLQLVRLERGKRVRLADSSSIEIRGQDVGRVNQFGNFWPFTPGTEIIFDGNIYMPPLDTRQRKVPDVLGTHKLAMGDGYLIHGTNKDTSIGEAVSHGCVRMFNEDVAKLYSLVPVGTPIYIF